MPEKCQDCEHVEWEEGGHGYPDTRLCAYGGKFVPIKWGMPCPMDLEAARAEADRLYPDRPCEECANYNPHIDMGWSHSDETTYCWRTRKREPVRGGEGCIFQPKGDE